MTTAEDTDEPEVTDIYLDAGEWVDHWLAPALEGKWQGNGKGKVLCPEWYRHRMVALRIHSLWREWEKSNREDTMSSWWVYHFDAHTRAIFDGETGPMYQCSTEKHREDQHQSRTPRVHRVPPGWFDQGDGGGPDFRAVTN